MHDANRRVLNDGDGVSRKTKIENIRLVDPRHGIDCKFDGMGAMQLKSGFVNKV